MMTPLSRIFRIFCTTLAFVASAAAAAANDANANQKHKFKLPPSADLHYAINAKQHGIPLSGEASLSWEWNAAEARYRIASETKASLLGKIQENKSEGSIDEYGLAPLQFTEKRFRKNATTTFFKRDSKQITFSESPEIYPLKGGEQDRTSAAWQLLAMARATPEKFVNGSEWSLFVAGRRDAEPWVFKVISHETISTPMGKLKTLHLAKAPPPDSQDQQLDLWLAPTLEWYPVRLRFADADGDFVEQLLDRIGQN